MQNEGKRRAFELTCETCKYGNRRAQRGQKWGQTRNCKNALTNQDCRSELWRDVSRNGIFWCPFLVLGIGYWVFGYIHTYICIYIYWVLGIGVYTYMYTHLYIENGGWGDITWSIIMKKHMVQTNAQYQICVMSMEVCFDMMVHGRSSWNNIRPKPRLNTKMSNLLWMICIMYRFHMMYMVITEATYDPSQDPIPVCRI